MMKKDLDQFVKDYILTWSTTNLDSRKQLVDTIYAESAEFYANEPGDDSIKRIGKEEILKNITQVNERLVVENGLATECSGYSENHNILKVSWQMKTPIGDIALKGMNILELKNSEIIRDYIFIG